MGLNMKQIEFPIADLPVWDVSLSQVTTSILQVCSNSLSRHPFIYLSGQWQNPWFRQESTLRAQTLKSFGHRVSSFFKDELTGAFYKSPIE